MYFHFEISGNDIKDEQSWNKADILVELLVFHFEISGNDDIDEHPPNIPVIL